MSAEIGLSISQADLGYSDRRVLNGVEIIFGKGEIHCIFGRNGSGKSTMIKSLAGLLPLLKGQVFAGEELIGQSDELKRAKLISVILTGRPVVQNMTVFDFVGFGRYPYSNWLGIKEAETASRVDDALLQCGLGDLTSRMINDLSDGEMQKAQIARILVQDSPILLMDEPVAHLDLANKAEIFNILKSVSERGKTIVFSSHDLLFSMQLADHFCVLQAEKAIQMDSEKFREERWYEKVMPSDILQINSDGMKVRYGRK